MFKQLDRHKAFEIILVLAVIVSHLFIVFGNQIAVLNWFLTDDAFYYFKVAQNVAEGNGFTFDGINRANGFHPLWMAVCIPIFALASIDKILALRVVVFVLAALSAATSVLLYRLIKRYMPAEIAGLVALIWAFSRTFHKLTAMDGLENGIGAFFIVLLWERLTAFNSQQEIGDKPLRRIFGLGVIATLTILSRLDNVFLVLLGSVWLWLRWWQPPAREENTPKAQWMWRIKSGAAFNGVIVVVMLGYLAWNYYGFGTLMPVSGQVKVWWGSLPWTVYGKRVYNIPTLLEEFFSRDRNVGPWSILVNPFYLLAEFWFKRQGVEFTTDQVKGLVLPLAAAFVTIGAVLVWLNRKFTFETVWKMGLVPFFIGSILQIAYYKKVGSVAQKGWYWISEGVFIIICFAILLTLIYRLLQRIEVVDRTRIVLVVIVLLGVWLPYKHYRYIFGKVENGLRMETHDYLHRAEWLLETFEPGTVLAVSGSGSWGYFTDHVSLFNMDGLINDYQYLQYMKAGRGADYLAKSGVAYVLGNPYIIENANPYGPMLEGHLEFYTKYYPPFGGRKFVWQFLP